MSGEYWDDQPSKTSLAAADTFLIIDSVDDTSKQIVASNILSYMQSPWGADVDGGANSIYNLSGIQDASQNPLLTFTTDTVDFNQNQLTNLGKSFPRVISSVALDGGTVLFNLTNSSFAADVFECNLSADTIIQPVNGTTGNSFVIYVDNTGSTSHTIDFTGTILNFESLPFSLSQTQSAKITVDVLSASSFAVDYKVGSIL